MASDDQDRQHCCFQEWMSLQKEDLSELIQAQNPENLTHENDVELSQLAEKTVQHFKDYMHKRQALAHVDVSAFFAPKWCTSLENSLLWIAGCRPSMFIRLAYALCGSEIESKLAEFLQGVGNVNLGGLGMSQLRMVNDLQRKTIREEDKLSSRLASLQEEIADQPISVIAKRAAGQTHEANSEVEKALDDHARAMTTILEKADLLRLSTLKELINIMTPAQGVDFLIASKKLHLCLHEWGKERDHKHGRV